MERGENRNCLSNIKEVADKSFRKQLMHCMQIFSIIFVSFNIEINIKVPNSVFLF